MSNWIFMHFAVVMFMEKHEKLEKKIISLKEIARSSKHVRFIDEFVCHFEIDFVSDVFLLFIQSPDILGIVNEKHRQKCLGFMALVGKNNLWTEPTRVASRFENFDDWDHHIEGKTQHLPRRFAIYIDTKHWLRYITLMRSSRWLQISDSISVMFIVFAHWCCGSLFAPRPLIKWETIRNNWM